MAKIGIALGGGGVRGLAHLGVLQVLEDEGVPISCITGSSVGAVVGAAYAQTPHASALLYRFRSSFNKFKFYEDVEKACESEPGEIGSKESFWGQVSSRVKKRIVVNLAQSKQELFPSAPMIEVIQYLVEEGYIEETNIPLGIVASDLNTGDSVVFTEGDIIEAVVASSSVTGYIRPIEQGIMMLTDGGVVSPIPVEFLPSLGGDISIAVDITYTKCPHMESYNVVDTVLRADMCRSKKMANLMMDLADIKIRPDVGHIHWSQFSRFEECLEAGRVAGKASISEIKAAMEMFDKVNAPPPPPIKEKWWERVLNYMGQGGQYA
jgi:NTE family protein